MKTLIHSTMSPAYMEMCKVNHTLLVLLIFKKNRMSDDLKGDLVDLHREQLYHSSYQMSSQRIICCRWYGSIPADNRYNLDMSIIWCMVSQVNGQRRSREAVARRARNKEIRWVKETNRKLAWMACTWQFEIAWLMLDSLDRYSLGRKYRISYRNGCWRSCMVG